jgi:hypothetical protein
MARGRFVTALAVLLLMSAGGVAHATESEERALREQLADKDEYRAKLLLELQRRESLLAQQQDVLSHQEDVLQQLYAKLAQPVNEDEEDAAPGPGAAAVTAVDGRKIKPDNAQARRSKDFETQTYKVLVARRNVAATKKEIDYLKGLLARNP